MQFNPLQNFDISTENIENIMIWDPHQNLLVNAENNEQLVYLEELNNQIDEQLHYEEEYENFLMNSDYHNNLILLSAKLIYYQHLHFPIIEHYKSWNIVPNNIKILVKDIMTFRLANHISAIVSLENANVNYSNIEDNIFVPHLLRLANIYQNYLNES